jgi:diguanylate cyclase (GGDEF)-like protein
LPGFIGPFPSTSLDESSFCFTCSIVQVLRGKYLCLSKLYGSRGLLSNRLAGQRERLLEAKGWTAFADDSQQDYVIFSNCDFLKVAEKVNLLMKDTHLRGRLTTFGLMAVLLVLTVCSIGATLIVRETSVLASEAVHMSDLYQQAHYLVGSESSIMHEYTLQPGSAARAEFRTTTRKLLAVLQTIAHDGDANDRTFVQSVLTKQIGYQLLAYHFFTLIDAHDLTSAIVMHDDKIDPLFDPIDVQVGTAANTDHQFATQSLTHLDAIQRFVMVSTVLVFVIGLFLLLLFWKMMRGYQRRLQAAAQVELLRMEQVALTDPLTGLPNHRTMMDRIDEELVRCQQTQGMCAVVFVDLDHFKHINDTWGHRAGDSVLREASCRLKKSIRREDAVGRYGGEEFVLVLTNTDLHAAKCTAERLRVALAEEPCSLESEEDTPAENAIAITASIGVAVYGEHGTNREALIEAADRAMYYAKQTGRNQVCLAGEETALTSQVLASMPGEQFTETVGIKTLAAVASVHDGKTSAHAHRMVRLAEETARGLGRSEEEVHLVRLAALFHDIGKIGIPDAILHKPGPLTGEEWTVMRRHPVLGQHILEQAGGVFELLSHIVVAHHERWDGRGYPHGLAQSAIPLGARILTVVDSYDAMTSERPYRQPMSDAHARAELQRCAGSQYDPQVVEVFLDVLDADAQSQEAPPLAKELPHDALPSSTMGELPDREAVAS